MARSPPFFGWAPAAWRGRWTVSGWQRFNHGDHLVPERSQPSQLRIEVGQPPAQECFGWFAWALAGVTDGQEVLDSSSVGRAAGLPG